MTEVRAAHLRSYFRKVDWVQSSLGWQQGSDWEQAGNTLSWRICSLKSMSEAIQPGCTSAPSCPYKAPPSTTCQIRFLYRLTTDTMTTLLSFISCYIRNIQTCYLTLHSQWEYPKHTNVPGFCHGVQLPTTAQVGQILQSKLVFVRNRSLASIHNFSNCLSIQSTTLQLVFSM